LYTPAQSLLSSRVLEAEDLRQAQVYVVAGVLRYRVGAAEGYEMAVQHLEFDEALVRMGDWAAWWAVLGQVEAERSMECGKIVVVGGRCLRMRLVCGVMGVRR